MKRKSTRLYNIWQGVKQRCNNPNCNRYRYYGAKGIKMCDAWSNSFEEFYNWSHLNGYSDDLSIDRIDSSKDYCPENCRWIPAGLNASLAQSKRYGRTEAWTFEHWNDYHH